MVYPESCPPFPSKVLTKVESAWIDYTYSFIEECAIGYIKDTRNQQADLHEVAEFLSCYIRNNKPRGLVSTTGQKARILNSCNKTHNQRTICWTESILTK